MDDTLVLNQQSLDTRDLDTVRKPIRLHYLDGARGLAALYVVVFHAGYCMSAQFGNVAPHWLFRLLKLSTYGHSAVVAFIVLSGYCLMLPVVQSDTYRLKGGFKGFMTRRALRILPPYYAAVFQSIALIWLTNAIASRYHITIFGIPPINPAVILSHLFMVQNLNALWSQAVDPPLWSLGTEWQIYFVFGLLLLPLWRRFGMIPTLVASFLIGLAPHFLLPRYRVIDGANYWLLGAFAIGMCGAFVNFGRGDAIRSIRERTPWRVVTSVLVGVVICMEIAKPGYWAIRKWLIDPWVAAAFSSALVTCTHEIITNGRRSWLLQLFNSGWATRLGSFSYSLYLIHYPILSLVSVGLQLVVHSAVARILLSLGLGIPVCILWAYLFFCVFEKPFLTRRAQSTAERSTVLDKT